MTPIPGKIKSSLTVELVGRGIVKLGPNEHVATGGEGSVYKLLPNTMVKIYLNPKKMQDDGMVEKLKLLQTIKHPFIVAPQGLVYENNNPVGYYMNFEPGEPLARIFTTSYRQRENFTDKHSIQLVDGMHSVLQTAHANHALLVDANEFNWLVAKTKKSVEPRSIDVDSWSIGKWKPSVIMPSIRDWHAHGFTEQSDWFSFAVVSFQVFTGIHPYKGMLPGYSTNEIERRMKENKSVFTNGVRLNNSVRSFDCIPDPLLAWYESVFQNGERSIPPLASDTSIKTPKASIVKKIVVTATGTLVMNVLCDGINDNPVEVYPCGIVRFASGALLNLENGKRFSTIVHNPCEIIRTDWGYLLVEIQTDGGLHAVLLDKDGLKSVELSTILKALHVVRYQNRIFVVRQQGLTELSVSMLGKPLLVTKNTWSVMFNSTKWYEGVGVQDTLGTTYLVAPFGESSCQYVHTPELNGKKVVSAVAGTRTIVVVALDKKTGLYQNYEFVLNKDYTDYQLHVTDATGPERTMTLLPKGITVSIVDDGNLVITVPTQGTEKVVPDARIDTSYVLAHWSDRVVAICGNKVWSISTK